MPHVLVAGRIHEAGVAFLGNAAGFTLDVVEDVSLSSYLPLIGQADAILIRTQPLPGSAIELANKLKIVSRYGVGYDSVDVAALSARNIPLTIIGDVNSGAVAEHTMMLMLSVAHKTMAYDASLRAGDWDYRDSLNATELSGKTLLVLGFGRIGRAVARLAKAFGMRVVVYDPYISIDGVAPEDAEHVANLAKALQQADILTVHIPSVGGRPLIGRDELAYLRKGALVINTARGGLIDEEALSDGLQAGHLGGAGLDVFASEPPMASNPLLQSEHTILTPHCAGLTAECSARMAVAAARNIVDFFRGSLDPSLIVNRKQVQKEASPSG